MAYGRGVCRTILRNVIFTLVSVFASFVVYDLYLHGTFKQSTTAKILNESGASVHIQHAYDTSKQAVNVVYGYAQKHGPVVTNKVTDVLCSYTQLVKDFGLVICNAVSNATDSFVSKCPGWTPIKSISHPYQVVENSIQAVNCSAKYLANEVFVGQLSPQNMQRVIVEAINTTQSKATEYYHWISEKIQTALK